MCRRRACPSHVCTECGAEFIASDRIYRREAAGGDVCGIGVWPHGRRPVRVEDNDDGWTIVVAGEGSMLINHHAMSVIPDEVFTEMWPWEAEEWASRRGFDIDVRSTARGWEIVPGRHAGFFSLVVIKTWWRSLGRSPVATAIDRLSCEISSPVWLPE